MDHRAFELRKFDNTSPIIVTALHSGQHLSPAIADRIQISKDQRFFEEDPYTELFCDLGSIGLHGTLSRFECDLNRPIELSVYRGPQEAWGLAPWKDERDYLFALNAGQKLHEDFYASWDQLIRESLQQHSRVLHLNIHSFNQRRHNDPLICVSTKVLPLVWQGLVQNFASALETCVAGISPVRGPQRPLVALDVPFPGGYFSKWTSAKFSDSVCSLQLEFNKDLYTYENETLNVDAFEALKAATRRSLALVLPDFFESPLP